MRMREKVSELTPMQSKIALLGMAEWFDKWQEEPQGCYLQIERQKFQEILGIAKTYPKEIFR